MATDLVVEALNTIDGLEPTVQHPDSLSGNLIPNTPRGRVFARITNNEVVTITATAVTTVEVAEGSSGDLTVQDPVYTLLAGDSLVIGPWSQNFNDANSKVGITWTGVTLDSNVDIEVMKIV